MINIEKETTLSLSEAARHLPAIDGKKPHASTLWRWCRKGVGPKQTRLEYVRFGHRIVTSVEAIQRFTERLAEADSKYEQPEYSPRTERPSNSTSSTRRAKAIADAEAHCEAAGI